MITLRDANETDAELLDYWDKQPHLSETGDDDWNYSEELKRSPAWREWLIAELAGRPIGMMQIIDPLLEDSHYWGDCAPNLRAIDIWIGEPDMLGKGYGTEMMKLAIARCFAPANVTAILIDPLVTNTRAHRFYERLGFVFVEERTFGDDACRVYKLERQ